MSKIKTILSIIFIFTIWGCVSSAYPILWWSRECVLYLIIIIKPEVWIINHCLGLGHETMVCAVCLTMFLCKYISVTFACNGCLSKLCPGIRGPNRNALISVSTTVFDESASSVLNVHSTMISSLKSWLCYFRSFSKVATKLSCLSLLLDKAYMTLIMTFDLDDNLGSWAQFQKLIHTTSFRINQIINTWIFKVQLLLALRRRW